MKNGIAAHGVAHGDEALRARVPDNEGKIAFKTLQAFEPALALYRKTGFVNGEAFGGYEVTPFNQFLHLDLVPAA